MKEFKGTKGDWYLQKFSDAYTNIIRCNNRKGFETIYLGSTSQSVNPEERANAKLMAAAPDLLEALQSILSTHRHVVDTGEDSRVRHFEDFERANQAINKALG